MGTQSAWERLWYRIRTQGSWTTANYLLFTVFLERAGVYLYYVFSALPHEALHPVTDLTLSVEDSPEGITSEDREVLARYGGDRLVRDVDNALRRGERCVIPRAEGTLAGMAWITRVDGYAPAGCGPATMIERCFTLPEYRGRGIFPASLRQALQHLSRSGAGTAPVYIECSTMNVSSATGISKAGFARIGLLLVVGRYKRYFPARAPHSIRTTEGGGALRSAIKVRLQRVCSRAPFRRIICWNVACREPLVALTFDDGPTNRWTPDVLDILEESRTPATFFVQSNYVQRYPDIFRRIVGAGHEIGNHGYDHSPHGMRAQVDRCDRTLMQFGVRTRLFRPPNGLLGWPLLCWLVRSGYTTVMWSFDALDSMREEGKWHGKDPKYSEVVAGDIVLLHDDNASCVRDLPALLEILRRKGLQPVVLSRLVGLTPARRPASRGPSDEAA